MLAEQTRMAAPVQRAYTCEQDPQRAAAALYDALPGAEVSLLIFFCSTDYDLQALSSALSERFVGIPVVGCTTAGEITPLGYANGSITAVTFSSRCFTVETALIQDLAGFDFACAQQLVDRLLEGCRARKVAPIKGHTFALALLDGLSILEEQLLLALNASLGSIPLLGGSAGDDLHLRDTRVYYQGRFHSDAAVLILINSACDFEVFSVDHLEETSEKLVVTEADSATRRVYELNAEPAASVYARSIGVEVDALNSLSFALNPLSVRINDRYYTRAVQRVNPDLSLSFYCAIDTGIVLTRSAPHGILQRTERLFDDLRKRIGPPQLVLGYDCIFRRLEIEHRGLTGAASRLLEQNQVVGFSTYGEQFDGMHLNQTFTGVAIGGYSCGG